LFTSPASAALNCPRLVIMSGACGSAQATGALGQHPPGSLVTTNIFFAELTSYHRGGQGAAIDASSFGGGRCRTCRQHPPGGSPLTSSHQWWPLSDLPPAPPRGPAIDVSSFGVAAAGPAASTPRGAAVDVSNIGGGHCRKSRQQPPGGPPSTSPPSVVVATRPIASTPQGARC
jgi:hypothetical protein